MNFANVKALAIPEGNVKQIADGQGVVLWKKDVGFQFTSCSSGTIASNKQSYLSGTTSQNKRDISVYFDNASGNTISVTYQGTYSSPWYYYPKFYIYLYDMSNTYIATVADESYTMSSSKTISYTIPANLKKGYFKMHATGGNNGSSYMNITSFMNLTKVS